ncbi:yeti [Anticarsia gemmatalis]|uniref:yeti n=1 Tax=Anticarsia gemmatalis TaxID=129554 RepID=UPI003F763864
MSSGSESDDDYVPGEPEQLSEEESANEETDQQYEKEVELKVKKRKVEQESKGKKKRKTRNGVTEIRSESPEEQPEEIQAPLNPEEEKKKEDDLWAKFLEGTDTKPKPAAKQTTATVEPSKPVAVKADPPKKQTPADDNKAREQRIFEFAGETIVVENNKIKEKIKTAESPATGSSEGSSRSRPGGAVGLSSVLGQLNKKNKLSTLEKSKLDWSTYKQDEGIEEEIESHNKGKNGYLDRRDFLERSDVRQYEIERDLRMNRRSNR